MARPDVDAVPVDVPRVVLPLVGVDGRVIVERARLFRRLSAGFVDVLLYTVALIVLSPVVGGSVAWWLSIGVLVLLLVMQGMSGQTPGKRLVGLLVVRASGWMLVRPVGSESDAMLAQEGAFAPVGVMRSFVRFPVDLLSAALIVPLFFGLFDRRRRLLSDLMTGTQVVSLSKPVTIPVVEPVETEG